MKQPDLSYMKPPKSAYDIKHPDSYVVNGKPPKYNRMIYSGVEYLEYETQKINEFKAEIVKQQDIKLPDDWKNSDYLKVLLCSEWKPKESVKNLQTHLQWRNDKKNYTLHSENLPLLQQGIIYVHGRDKNLRPIVILNAHLIDLKKNSVENICQAISYLLTQVISIMMIPYHIENWVMIIETNKLGITSLPVSALGTIIGNMQTNFCGRMDKMYILNPSTGVKFVWSTIKGFVNALTLQKIGFLTTKTIKEIQQKVDIDQLEQKYGGTKQNLTKYWPPINIDPILDQETYPIIDPKKTPIIMLEVGSRVNIDLLELDPKIILDQDIEQQLSLNIKQLSRQKSHYTSQQDVAPQEINFTQPVPLESSERVMYPQSDGQILHQNNNYSVKDEFEQIAIITPEVPVKHQIDDQELIHQQTSDFKENEVLLINETPRQEIELVNDPQSSAIILKISFCESKEVKLEVSEDVNNDFINNIRLPSVRVEQDTNMDPPTNQKGCCQTCVIF